MWDELVRQVGVIWIILVLLAAAALIALTVVFFISLYAMSRLSAKRFVSLTVELDDLPGCRIENLAPARELVSELMNVEFKDRFEQMAEDSTTMYYSIWLPAPQKHLTLPEIIDLPTRLVSRKTNGFSILLGGIVVSTLALASGYILNGSLLDAPVLRFAALVPLIISMLCMLFLHQSVDFYSKKTLHLWQLLMTAIERKLPIFSTAAETARMISEMREYDAHMAKSVAQVATHVQNLASGKMTDAVASAVKYVMAATVAPAVVKSSESLGLLAEQLEKQMQQTDFKVAKLYTELESRQESQSELWLKRYQEVTDVLAAQQDAMLKNLTSSEQHMVEQLSKAQRVALDQIIGEQTKTYESMRAKYDSVLDEIHLTQTAVYDNLLSRQTESFELVATSQQQAYQQVAASQLESIQTLQSQQAAVLAELDNRQDVSLQTINEQQVAALKEFRQAQTESLAAMSGRQQEAVQYLAENFGSEVSSKLSSYLEPISVRLHDASEALIAAQNYSKDVKDVLKMQNESATALQTSIGELFGQLVDTRKSMSEDLVSLKGSSSVMSKAAEIMGSVYAGSQSGLSEAVSMMSRDLMRLSEVLSAVMEGSAEQTLLMQSQSIEAHNINQQHLEAVRGQVTLLSDELSTRIDQMMLGFSNLTNDLVTNVNTSINSQNDILGGNLRSLTDVMSEEARSMSLFAQQINMDIDSLNQNLKSAVSEFDAGMRNELSGVLSQFDSEVADIVKRLARSATELGDAVDALPEAIRHARSPARNEN